jgi:hypothetical protein
MAAFLSLKRVLAVGIWAAVLGLVTTARAAPPQGSDPSNAQWFESLQQPGNRLPCCSIADCRPAQARTSPTGDEVLIEGPWLAVPSDRVLQQVGNPLVLAIVCSRRILDPDMIGDKDARGIKIFCFVRPPEA